MNCKYILLNSDKQPMHKFKDGVGAKSWDEVKDFDNIGMIVPEPFIVLDFDTASDAQIMLRIIEDLGLQCRVMKTTRGIHVWFRSSEPWKNFTKTRNAIGIYSDCRSYGKTSFVMIRKDGKDREWLRDMHEDLIVEVPRWLYPVSCPSNMFNFKGMTDGDGRNQALFNYIVYLQGKGFTRDEIRETITIINNHVLSKPLPDAEIRKLLRDEAFKPEEEIQAEQEARQKSLGGWSHNEFGDLLIQQFNIISYNDTLYIYEDGYYQADERIIEKRMIEMYPSIKQSQRNEVMAYIRIQTHIIAGNIKPDPWTVNLINTRIDLRTGAQLDHTPDAIEFDRIPVVYDPDAYNASVDKMLDKVFCHDAEVRSLFEEMLGYCLMRHADYQKAFMFYGSGSNGKSTLLDLIKAFMGKHNYVSIDIEQLTRDRFAGAELENKLANIGDDVNDSSITGTGVLKKLIAGNAMQVQRKGERPFQLEPYAKHIYSCNDIPRSATDKTHGFYRRWCFIPLHAVFSSKDPDYDPMIKDKIMTANAMSYLLNLALTGATRLIQTGSFTEPQSVLDTMETYKIDNSTTLSWVDDAEIEIDQVVEKSRDELYSDFSDWCKLGGMKQIPTKKTFFREMREKFDLDAKPRFDNKTRKRYFRPNLED